MQPLRVDSNLFGYEAVIEVEISYTDQYGNPYSETSILSFEVVQYGATATPLPATPTLSVRPQILIEQVSTDPGDLSPGTVFTLNVNVVNVSSEIARQVVVTLAQSETSLEAIAPLSTSNVRYIEQMTPGERITLSYEMAVNGSAESGLVPINLQLSYIDNYNVEHDETETISLAVNALPYLQIRLFEPLPEGILVGDTFDVPIEIINIGTTQVNVSTVEVVSIDNRLTITEGSVYIGPLDPGTSGSVVAVAEANQAGTATIEVRVNYLNNFQQPETLVQTIPVVIEAAPIIQPGDESEGGEADGELSLLDRILRAILGFFGLGTTSPDDSNTNDNSIENGS
jgi:hypothetical protein